MHLDGNSVPGLDGALAAGGTRVDVASDRVAGDALDGAVAQGSANAGTSVQRTPLVSLGRYTQQQ